MQRFNHNGRWLTLEQYQNALNKPVEEVTSEVEQFVDEELNEPVEPNLGLSEPIINETKKTKTKKTKTKKTK